MAIRTVPSSTPVLRAVWPVLWLALLFGHRLPRGAALRAGPARHRRPAGGAADRGAARGHVPLRPDGHADPTTC